MNSFPSIEKVYVPATRKKLDVLPIVVAPEEETYISAWGVGKDRTVLGFHPHKTTTRPLVPSRVIMMSLSPGS